MTPPPPSCPLGATTPRHDGNDSKKNKNKKSLQDWWPQRLDLTPLHVHAYDGADPHVPRSATTRLYGGRRDLNHAAVWRDVQAILRPMNANNDASAWPADYGHYGGLLVRAAWHAAGTYRVTDGRGGADGGRLRLAPLVAWPDNANLEKAVRLILWPVKRRYGQGLLLSWADLIVLAGTVALHDMGLPVFGFGFGRTDDFCARDDMDFGPEGEWLQDERHDDDHHHDHDASKPATGDTLRQPLGAVQMGLIYVNPEGPGGNGNPLDAAHDIRTTFARMGMNDAETVALIAGGHTFGKAHGAAAPETYVGPDPEGAPLHHMGLGWRNTYGTGKGADTITSGLEGAWTAHPTKWDNGYFDNLFGYEWKQTKSPAGAIQWIPTDPSAATLVPDAHDPGRRHAPIMFTTDLALRYDPLYRPIAERYWKHFDEFQLAFAKAWYKLTHRDMGPVSRLAGPYVPPAQSWQDPLPPVTYATIQSADVQALKQQVLMHLGVAQLVRTAWASASTFRGTDRRGGANGARICLAPQITWAVNNCCSSSDKKLSHILDVLRRIQTNFNEAAERQHDGKRVSMADLIVLGGCAAIEAAAKQAGFVVHVPFVPGRTDATQEQTDVESFQYLEPEADGFRNWINSTQRSRSGKTELELLVEKAYMLQLSVPEMTVLVGGLRVLDANADNSPLGVLTRRPQVLSNDFFCNVLDLSVTWQPSGDREFVGTRGGSASPQWRASKVDLIFGSHSELRAISEYYACDDAKEVFVKDFVAAWTKVMNNDRFDIDAENPSSLGRSNSSVISRL